MTGLQRAVTEEDRSAVIMRSVFGLVIRKQGSQSALSDCAGQLAPLTCLIRLSLRENITERITSKRLTGES